MENTKIDYPAQKNSTIIIDCKIPNSLVVIKTTAEGTEVKIEIEGANQQNLTRVEPWEVYVNGEPKRKEPRLRVLLEKAAVAILKFIIWILGLIQ